MFVVVALLAWPAMRHLRESAPAQPTASRLSLSPPSPDVELGSGEESLDAAISPDGREIVFVATAGGIPKLWRRSLGGDRAAAMPGTEGAQQPAWKPTGNVIAFFAAGKLKQISLTDGIVRDLAEAPMPAGATWQPDGSLVFAAGRPGPLRQLREGTLTSPTALHPGDLSHVFPATVGVRGFVYIATRADGQRRARVVYDGEEHDLTQTSGHAQLVEDQLLHVRDGTLLAHRFDRETGTLVGRGMPLGLNVGVSRNGRALMVAAPRLLLFAASTPRPRELAWLDANGRRTGTSGEPGDYWQVRLSPDDRQIAATMLDPLLRALDVVIVATDRAGGPERLTLALAADTDPVWSPDGMRVVFRSFQDGQPNLFTRRVGVRGAPDEALLRAVGDETPTDWSANPPPTGQVVFSKSSPSGNSDVVVLDVRARSQAAAANTGFNETDARWSPDQRWLSYVSDESGQPDIYVSRWPDGGRTRVSFAGGTRPRWAADGRALFFLRGDELMRAERHDMTDSPFQPARRVLIAKGVRDFDTAHRSNKLLLLMPVESYPRADVRVLVEWQSTLSSGL